MYIKDIELNNFRNYKDLKISFDEKVNLILGDNAQGKTNLIEAIYITSLGKSFRTAKDRELISFDSDFARIKVNAEKEDYDTSIEIILEKSGSKSVKKRIVKDRKNLTKTSELIKNILIVCFSPEDMKIVKEEPEKRRRFLDREMCQISTAYYENYSGYRRILNQRNAYLKEERIDPTVLDVWDTQLSVYAAGIMARRKAFIDKLSEISGNIHQGITEEKEKLVIKYDPNIELKENIKEQEALIYQRLKDTLEMDNLNRTTMVGPHRDDMAFFVNDIDMRNYGSQGQQRTAALSLKLAEIELIKEDTGEEAILLLDDVMSELDAGRQEFLIKTLRENQLFITTTNIDKNVLGELRDATIYSVRSGDVVKQRV